MDITQTDLARCRVVINALKRAKYELDGIEETLGLAQAFHWVTNHAVAMEHELKAKALPQAVALAPVKNEEKRTRKPAKKKAK